MGLVYHDKTTGEKTTTNREEAWAGTQYLDAVIRTLMATTATITTFIVTTLTVTTATITKAIIGTLYESPTVVNAATYNLLITDSKLHVTYTDTGTVAIAIPTDQIIDDRIFKVVDAGNGATTYNITITPASGDIQHDTSLVMSANGQAITFYCYDGNIFIE